MPPSVHSDAVRCLRGRAARERKRKKKKKKKFGSCCRLEKREKNFGFRFSIPKIPKLPELRGLHERSREKKKVFSA
jgi:hypothetical protein